MRITILLLSAALALAAPASAQKVATAESKLAGSSVSIAVDPALNDGRLVIKVAAQNRGAGTVPFGPGNVSLATPEGGAIALYSLDKLVDDVRLAAGMTPEPASGTPTQGAYASPQLNVRDGGRVDVSGYTGGSAVGRDEFVRRAQPRRKVKPTISEADAQQQIALLKSAILQDTALGPNQVAAGQVVSAPLQLKKGEDRTLHLRVRVGADEHGFTIAAPKE